jgi:hypothetical protein
MVREGRENRKKSTGSDLASGRATHEAFRRVKKMPFLTYTGKRGGEAVAPRVGTSPGEVSTSPGLVSLSPGLIPTNPVVVPTLPSPNISGLLLSLL